MAQKTSERRQPKNIEQRYLGAVHDTRPSPKLQGDIAAKHAELKTDVSAEVKKQHQSDLKDLPKREGELDQRLSPKLQGDIAAKHAELETEVLVQG